MDHTQFCTRCTLESETCSCLQESITRLNQLTRLVCSAQFQDVFKRRQRCLNSINSKKTRSYNELLTTFLLTDLSCPSTPYEHFFVTLPVMLHPTEELELISSSLYALYTTCTMLTGGHLYVFHEQDYSMDFEEIWYRESTLNE